MLLPVVGSALGLAVVALSAIVAIVVAVL